MTNPDAYPPNPNANPEDIFHSINGWDEIAIARAFGQDLSDLRTQPFRFMRALLFVDRRRAGDKDADAYRTVMGLTVEELEARFPKVAEVPEIDPDEPVSDEGKDAEPPIS